MKLELMLSRNSGRDDLGRQMRSYLPYFYAGSPVMNNLLDCEAEEIGKLQASIDDTLAQLFVDTATWGLKLWEQLCDLPTDTAKPLDQRRSVIKSKLRGVGTVTVELIQNVAEAYDGGKVEVSEQPEQYQFTITFVDTRGIPANLDDLKAAIEEIKPAHLTVRYEFNYLTWDELDAAEIVWNHFDEHPMTWKQFEIWKL